MADYRNLSELLASTANLVQIVNNTAHDDDTITVDGVSWFQYGGIAATKVYISGNSWFGFGASSEHLKVCRRDGKLYNLWREEGTLYNTYSFLRFKWDGYTQYNNADTSVKLTYEVYLFSTGDLFLNILQDPTNSSYLGTNELVCSGGTKSFTVTSGVALQETFTHQDTTGANFVATQGQIVITPPYDRKYLLQDTAGKYYSVENDALKEVSATEAYVAVTDITTETALWVDSKMKVNRDTGNARAYVFPINQGTTYRITMTEIGDRERIALSTDNPRLLTAGNSVTVTRTLKNQTPVINDVTSFTATANENWCTVHVSSTGQTPAIAIERYRSALVNCFETYGLDAIPAGSLMLQLNDPILLYWQDSIDELPAIEMDVTAMPFPQTVLTHNVDMTDSTIKGVEKVEIDSDESTLYAVSFDNGATWWNYVDSAWAELSEAQSGMTKAAMEAIGTDAWALKATTGHIRFRFVLVEGSYVNHIIVDYLN